MKANMTAAWQPTLLLSPRFGRAWLATALLVPTILLSSARAVDSTAVKKLFAQPPREYATAPLWVWNDLLTEQQIRDTMRDLAGQQVKQVFVHPRPGLMTPYLSADWFRLWKVALDEAEKLDMNVWIYDENSYPSGFAGGWVPEAMPEARGRGLVFGEEKAAPKWSATTIAVYRLGGDRLENVSAQVKAGETLPEARYLVASEVRAANSPWHGNRCYVNLLSPGVTEKFLELTMEPYRREIGNQFGKRVPGAFTDEPNIRPAGGLPWSEVLAQEFQKRWGYNLLDHLPSLTREVGDWRKIRHNYFAVLNEQFIEHWAKPYHDYCEKYGLEFTGHYWDHEWPNCVGVPDNMAMYAWHQRPAIDCLMNQYQENTHAQFGNVRMARELASIANQLGRKRTLCEIYGAGGWDLRFEDMKRIGDWLEVLGVNTLDEHLSYITLRGARKRDHPQSFSYHEPWWEAYHVNASYLTRLSCALSQGEQINRILVIEPTTTAWMYQGNAAKLKEIGDWFFQLLMALDAAQIEYDLGDEDVIARFGGPGEKAVRFGNDKEPTPVELKIGQRSYHTIVIPPGLENLDAKTDELFRKIKCPTMLPWQTHRDGALQADWLKERERTHQVIPTQDEKGRAEIKSGAYLKQLVSDLVDLQKKESVFVQRADNRGILFHMRRQLEDGQLLFLVNTSLESPAAGTIETSLAGAEQWNLDTGAAEPYPFRSADGRLKADFTLPPSGSLLLFLSTQPRAPAPTVQTSVAYATKVGETQIRRLEPNVLTLDYVDITAGGETRTNQYFYQANQFAWQKNGMERNPWDSAVQFKEELISKKFAPDRGFTASYRFAVEGAVPKNLAIVIERPDLYTITCNGQPATAKPEEWWLDKAFGRIPIASAARVGENVVTLKASPFTMYHELEPAYVLGDFTLQSAAKGFVIAPEQPLKLGKWNEQGHPFFSKGVACRQQFEVAAMAGQYAVSLPSWYGSVAKVTVNGRPAGYISAPPWECNVTKQLQGGQNEIEVVAIGTLKNTLGPHHGKPGLGSAWPGMFQSGPKDGPPPGNSYATVGYGLFEPFVLKQITNK
jgi:hypothetical protein